MKIYLALEHNGYDGMVEEVFAFQKEEDRLAFLTESGRRVRNKMLVRMNLPQDLDIGDPSFVYIGIMGAPQMDENYNRTTLDQWDDCHSTMECDLI